VNNKAAIVLSLDDEDDEDFTFTGLSYSTDEHGGTSNVMWQYQIVTGCFIVQFSFCTKSGRDLQYFLLKLV
jgi:hypothetical protein